MADKNNDCGCGCMPIEEKDKKTTKGKKEVEKPK